MLPDPEPVIVTAACATPSTVKMTVPVGAPPEAGVTTVEITAPVRMGALVLVEALLTTRVVAGNGATEAT